jgi:transcriptional regulator with XRE-family HTH domain
MSVTVIGTEPDPRKRIRLKQGRSIRQVRELRQMTIEGLAERVGVSAGAISHWETGRYSPRNHHQVAIAQALDVPWSTIFALDGEVA